MADFDWKSFVRKVAPFLGTALGGPLGGAAASALAGALGGDPTNATPDQLAKLVTNVTPEQLLALKKAETDFAAKMQELGFQHETDLVDAEVKDRDSARNREVQVKDATPAVGFYLISLGFFGILTFLLLRPVPDANKAVLFTMLGSLGTAWLAAVYYYYGKSSSDPIKDHMLFHSTPTDEGQK